MSLIIAGDQLDISKKETKIVIGPGLIQNNGKIFATQCGILNHEKHKYYVDNHQNRYVPGINEPVIGIITGRLVDDYKVDIGSAHNAILPYLSFEGATKRNRPNFKDGHLVYAQVSLANKDMEPRITCVSPTTQKSEGFGELNGGLLFNVSLHFSRTLIKSQHPVLACLGKKFPFEIAIGLNGRLWIKSSSIKETIYIKNILQKAENVKQEDLDKFISQI